MLQSNSKDNENKPKTDLVRITSMYNYVSLSSIVSIEQINNDFVFVHYAKDAYTHYFKITIEDFEKYLKKYVDCF